MIKSSYSVVGVMSGTSLDGIDLVHVNFEYNKDWTFNIIHAETIEYSQKWFDTLKELVSYSFEELKQIDKDYTIYLADIINNFIVKNKIENLDAVCSHGHTALHQPEKS